MSDLSDFVRILFINGKNMGQILNMSTEVINKPQIYLGDEILYPSESSFKVVVSTVDDLVYVFPMNQNYTVIKNEMAMTWEVRIITDQQITPFNFKKYSPISDVATKDDVLEKCTCEGCTNPNYFDENVRLPEVSKLPGIRELVKHPVSNLQWNLEAVIMSLNDDYKWSREQIADWLDTLDIDLRFT